MEAAHTYQSTDFKRFDHFNLIKDTHQADSWGPVSFLLGQGLDQSQDHDLSLQSAIEAPDSAFPGWLHEPVSSRHSEHSSLC